MSVDIAQLLNLPVAEQLRIVELLWDKIGSSSEELKLYPWHEEEIQRRRSDPSESIDEEELWRRVDGK
jgi:putative addiction module component (TIGR02574 family)